MERSFCASAGGGSTPALIRFVRFYVEASYKYVPEKSTQFFCSSTTPRLPHPPSSFPPHPIDVAFLLSSPYHLEFVCTSNPRSNLYILLMSLLQLLVRRGQQRVLSRCWNQWNSPFRSAMGASATASRDLGNSPFRLFHASGENERHSSNFL